MFRKVLLLVLILIASVSLMHEGFATVSVSYKPAPKIYMTGATTDVRFDVASVLNGSSFSGAHLDTMTKNMSGAFYIRNIGWALMSSGSFQVILNCTTVTNLKDILPTTPQCQFTGSGWSENIGEVGFASVRYDPSTATLSGKINSFAGDFDVEGVYLPLIRAQFNELLGGITANHALSYSIKNPERYVANNAWSMQVLPNKNLFYYRTVSGGGVGVFNSVDLSLADIYTFEITDPDGGVTEYSGIVVSPADASTTLDTTLGLFVKDFCDDNGGSCPDGSTRSATTHTRQGSGPVIADGVSAYNMTLKIRDKYGNRVTSGNVKISYTGTVSEIQLPSNITSLGPYTSLFSETLKFTGDIAPIYDFAENWESGLVNLGDTDITYAIASIAPTDTTDNRIVLNKIVYTSPSWTTQTITDPSYLEFDEPYTATLTPPTDLRVAATNVFTGDLTSSVGAPSNPKLITLFKIGDGNLALMDDLTLGSSSSTESPSTQWMIDNAPNTSHVIRSSIPPGIFTLTGTYTPLTAFPEIEKVYYQGFIHYNISGTDIVYPVFSGNKTAEYGNSRVKILGQNNARGEYGTIGTNTNSRTKLINQLRKNITLINRGRTSYTDVNYKVVTSDTNLVNTDFNIHQTIIAIGADITITEDIVNRIDHPLAIIALTDEGGNGGNIKIGSDVKSISATLIAEKAVESSGDNQLYIFGSIVSGNTLGETVAGICPYYVPKLSCDPKKYDLEHLRTYDGTNPTKASSSPRANEYPNSALIIEYDMRLQSDPPPGLSD